MASINDRSAREIIESNIDRDPVGRKLTPEARKAAVDFGVQAWEGQMGNWAASRLGIKHVTSGVFKDNK